MDNTINTFATNTDYVLLFTAKTFYCGIDKHNMKVGEKIICDSTNGQCKNEKSNCCINSDCLGCVILSDGSTLTSELAQCVVSKVMGRDLVIEIYYKSGVDITKLYIDDGILSVNIPASCKEVRFEYPDNLEAITVCSGNPYLHYDDANNVLIDDRNCVLIGFDNSKIPDYVAGIEERAFYDRKHLQSVDLPNSLRYIGRDAFGDCKSLRSITIPCDVRLIEDNFLCGCSNLEAIAVNYRNCSYDSRDGCNAIIETKSNTLIAACNSTFIPEGVTAIGSFAFYGCKSLHSITIPDSVTVIGRGAFRGCDALQNITIPDSVTEIGSESFEKCKSLQSVTMSNSVTVIGENAFCDCSSLQNIVIPDSVEFIGEFAFDGCNLLETIAIPASVEDIRDSIIPGSKNLTNITVDPANKVYDSRNNCNAIIETKSNTIIAGCGTTIIPEDVTAIGNSAFCSCEALQNVTLPESVTSIGEFAFGFCESLESITIPGSVVSIHKLAFSGCSALQSIVIPKETRSHFESLLSKELHGKLVEQ